MSAGEPFAAPLWRPGPPQAWLPRPYHQLLRGPNWRWWRPVVSVLVLAGFLLALVAASAAAVGAYLVASGRVEGLDQVGEIPDGDFEAVLASPAGLLLLNLPLAALVIGAQVAVWGGFGWRPRWVSSVVGGLRWRWLARTLVISLVLVAGATLLLSVAQAALDGGVDGGVGGGVGGLPRLAPQDDAALMLVVVLLTTPLQAAGEEYLFRGWLTQVLGAAIPRVAIGAVVSAGVSATLFAIAHGSQDAWLFADRLGFGLVASWLVWRTGGLEAGIALHAANNLVILGTTVLTGELQDALGATTSSPVSVVVDLVLLVAMALLLDRLARRAGLTRLFRPPLT